MYDIRQFKPTLYILVILGLTGFAVAAEEPGMWLLSMGGVLLNAWLVWKNKFRPMPRWIANTITLVGFTYVTMHIIHMTTTPILLIGQFLVLLHVVKLFEQRANRDYAQLLMLTFLLMVAAAISTARLGFAILFFPHMVLLLYCCLLYHLKVETDRAKAAQTLPEGQLNAATLRQDQRYLSRSMRRLTGLVSTVSLVCAVFVFLFFPRGSGMGMFGQLQLRSPEVLTGFSDEVQQNQVARITQNSTPVATVRVLHNDTLVTSGSLKLRGATYVRYVEGKGEWRAEGIDPAPVTVEADQSFRQRMALPVDDWRQFVRLEPIGSKAMFALAGVTSLTVSRETKIIYHRPDETLQRVESLNLPLQYEVVSNNALTSPSPAVIDDLLNGKIPRTNHDGDAMAAFARVAVGSQELLDRRSPTAGLSAEDEEIASRIEAYFKANFTYTLDLTDAAALFEGKDPLEVFVTQTRRGHCEYFAGAMTLACQRLGLQARMVVGFNTDEYNRYSEVFQVRQSHAHAWVEVLTPNHGWVTFDPTSGREFPPNEARSTWQRLKHVFLYLEEKWGTSVVAYDATRRENLIQQIDNSMLNTAIRGHYRMSRFFRWWDRLMDQTEFWTVSSKLLAALIAAMAVAMVGVVAWFIIDRRRIRRRAAKIGLDALPMTDQIRLARQLRFYEKMTEVLRRHEIARPRHLTPREFTRTLTFLPTEAYNTIDRLTRIFYRVRYGGVNIQPAQQRRLESAVNRLAETLPAVRDA
jgi:transglutaminase-like putative cysteine protease